MLIAKCTVCGKEFKGKKNNSNKYCSYECYHSALRQTNEFIIKDDFAIMVCNSKKYGRIEFIIDKEDVERCKPYKWHIDYNNNFYASTNIRVTTNKQKRIKLHRFIMNCPENKVVDHINRDTLDNRKFNMRICTQTDNKTNRKDNTSGRCGVYYNFDCKKWYARIQINKTQHDLGMFETKEEAINARKQAENKYNVEVI